MMGSARLDTGLINAPRMLLIGKTGAAEIYVSTQSCVRIFGQSAVAVNQMAAPRQPNLP